VKLAIIDHPLAEAMGVRGRGIRVQKEIAMKISRLVLFSLALLALALGPGVRRASPDSGSATFQYMAGGGAICSFFQGACPDIASADNGDTIEISGTGMLTIHPNSVGGAGTFKHKDSNGNLLESGTWTAQELASFVPYVVLSNNFAGGEALIRVHLSSGPDAILTVTCAIGAPPGHSEGSTLNIQDVINFNKHAGGITLYVKQ
jgi:hypothetical protein